MDVHTLHWLKVDVDMAFYWIITGLDDIGRLGGSYEMVSKDKGQCSGLSRYPFVFGILSVD